MAYQPPHAVNPENQQVFMDFVIGDSPPQRIIFELFYDVAPNAAENFRCLCTGEKGVSAVSGVPRHYKGRTMHRVIPSFMAQGGAYADRATGAPTGESIYSTAENPRGEFRDEFGGKAGSCEAAGLLCAANRGLGTQTCQFFIMFGAAPHLNQKHSCFGQVVSGFDVVRAMEAVGSSPKGTTSVPVLIADCGAVSYGGAGAGAGATQ